MARIPDIEAGVSDATATSIIQLDDGIDTGFILDVDIETGSDIDTGFTSDIDIETGSD
tara:strand:+ start:473 stop:646 length:174 start_codon:yes stop_codon:yes gene_type:complete